jgi:hypothetical protein
LAKQRKTRSDLSLCAVPLLPARVARWCVFKSKILIWVNFGMKKVGIVYCHWEYITSIRYRYIHIVWPFGNLAAICCIFPRFWYIK